MKLIIQIPCLNEADWLPATVKSLPDQVEGFDSIEILVIDDGSTDGTSQVAKSLGVHHVLQLHGRQGLARAFSAGLTAAVELGADVIVNTDADNQYCAQRVQALVQPILEGTADIVIGERPIKTIAHFSLAKRFLQRLGSKVVRSFSGTGVGDVTSGFRAMSRHAALRLNVFDDFTYTLETIIQAGLSNLRIATVPVEVNPPTRPSRLFRSNLTYICRSILTILSAYVIYRPARFFVLFSLLLFAPGLFLSVRYLVLMATGEGLGHVQSVIISGVLLICGFLFGAIGIVARLQGINRRLLEEIRFLLRTKPSGATLRSFVAADYLNDGNSTATPHSQE